MLFIENRETDPALNMAFEEHLFFNKTEEIFPSYFLYKSISPLIVGLSRAFSKTL